MKKAFSRQMGLLSAYPLVMWAPGNRLLYEFKTWPCSPAKYSPKLQSLPSTSSESVACSMTTDSSTETSMIAVSFETDAFSAVIIDLLENWNMPSFLGDLRDFATGRKVCCGSRCNACWKQYKPEERATIVADPTFRSLCLRECTKSDLGSVWKRDA